MEKEGEWLCECADRIERITTMKGWVGHLPSNWDCKVTSAIFFPFNLKALLNFC